MYVKSVHWRCKNVSLRNLLHIQINEMHRFTLKTVVHPPWTFCAEPCCILGEFSVLKCLYNRNRELLAYDSLFILSGKAQIIIMAQISNENSCSHPMEILCWTLADPGSVFFITIVYLTVTEDFWHMIHFSYDQEKLKSLSWHRFSLKTVVHTRGNFVLNLTLSWESFCYYECPSNRNRGHLVCGWKDSVNVLESPHPIISDTLMCLLYTMSY